MSTARKAIERWGAWALVLTLGLPAAAASVAVPSEGSLESLRKFLALAAPMAREWSPGAKLYSVHGRAPGNKERWESEEWGLIFGDPKAKDGSFHIVFKDGFISIRQGIKGGVRMLDQFKDGQFQSRETDFARDYSNSDYGYCRPLDEDFVDTDVLNKIIQERDLAPDSLGQYNFSLFRAFNDQCDGLGRHSLFLSDKPIPRRLMKRSLWVIHTPVEIVYIDARTGKIAFRRPS